MEPPAGRGGITPLPPPEPESARAEAPPARIAWAPALLALGAILAFAWWLSTSPGGDGAPADDGAAPTLPPISAPDTVPPVTTTEAPRLDEILPWIEGTLLVFEQTGNTENLLVWNAPARHPRSFPLRGSNIVTAPQPDPGSLSFMAYEIAGTTVRSLYVGGWRHQDPVFIGSRGFAWSPDGSGTVAWVGTDQVTGDTSIYSKTVGGSIVRHGDVPATTQLLAWVPAGLVTAETLADRVPVRDAESGEITVKQGVVTVVRNLDGATLARAAAEPLAVGAENTIVALGTADALALSGVSLDDGTLVPPPELLLLDVVTDGGGGVAFSDRPLPAGTVDDEPLVGRGGQWVLAPAGDWVARTYEAQSGLAVAAQHLESGELRTILLGLGETGRVLGFSRDGRFLFVFAANGNTLIIIDWETLEQFVLPPFDGTVSPPGVFLRP